MRVLDRVAVAASETDSDAGRLGADARDCDRRDPDLPSGGSKALPNPIAVDGADSSLRCACRGLSVAVLRSRDREPDRVSLPRAEAWRHHRLRGTAWGQGCLRRRWTVRQADRRASGRKGRDEGRPCLDRWSPSEGALPRARLPRPRERGMVAQPPRWILRAWRQPRHVLRLPTLGGRPAREHHRPSRRARTGLRTESASRSRDQATERLLARRSRCVGRWNSALARAAGWSSASGARLRRRPAPPAGSAAGQIARRRSGRPGSTPRTRG